MLSVNISKEEMQKLLDDYNKRLVHQKSILSEVQDYITSNMDPNKNLKDDFFKNCKFSYKLYMNEYQSTLYDLHISLGSVEDGAIISIPIHTRNFLKEFINKKNNVRLTDYVKRMIQISNSLNSVYKVGGVETSFKGICEYFGVDQDWRVIQ